jgi:hypothetical protein
MLNFVVYSFEPDSFAFHHQNLILYVVELVNLLVSVAYLPLAYLVFAFAFLAYLIVVDLLIQEAFLVEVKYQVELKVNWVHLVEYFFHDLFQIKKIYSLN